MNGSCVNFERIWDGECLVTLISSSLSSVNSLKNVPFSSVVFVIVLVMFFWVCLSKFFIWDGDFVHLWLCFCRLKCAVLKKRLFCLGFFVNIPNYMSVYSIQIFMDFGTATFSLFHFVFLRSESAVQKMVLFYSFFLFLYSLIFE